MILLQEAATHFHEVADTAAEQFHIYQSTDQLTLFHKHTFGLGGVKTEEVIPGTSKQDSVRGLKHLMVRSMFRRAPRQGRCTYASVPVHLSNTTAKRRAIARNAFVPIQGNCRTERRRHQWK